MEQNKVKVKRYKRHIEALETSYIKMIDILEKEMDSTEDEESGEKTITIKDHQIKAFSEGILRASETANALLIQIGQKEDDLEKLINPDKQQETKSKKEKDNSSNLNSRLR